MRGREAGDYARPLGELVERAAEQWYMPAPPGRHRIPPELCFEQTIHDLSDDAYDLLARIADLHLAADGAGGLTARALSDERTGSAWHGRGDSTEGTQRTLKMIAVCEFGLGILLHAPPAVREERFGLLARACGVTPSELDEFRLLWQHLRRTIEEEGQRER